MPQIMQPHVIETGLTADRSPRLFQIDHCGTVLVAGEDVRIAIDPRQGCQYRERRGWQMQRLGAAFAVGQPSLAALEVYPLPPQSKHLAEPRAGEDQQLDRRYDVGRSVIG